MDLIALRVGQSNAHQLQTTTTVNTNKETDDMRTRTCSPKFSCPENDGAALHTEPISSCQELAVLSLHQPVAEYILQPHVHNVVFGRFDFNRRCGLLLRQPLRQHTGLLRQTGSELPTQAATEQQHAPPARQTASEAATCVHSAATDTERFIRSCQCL